MAAQLPYLIYGQGSPMSSTAFKALARDAMNSQDARILEYCTLDPDPISAIEENWAAYSRPPKRTKSDFINDWKEWERTLRLNLAKGRLQKLKREGAAIDPPEYPQDAVTAAKTALAMESPLEAEIFLDKARWSAIENLQGISSFSENAMYAYLLKLLLMERRAAFITEEGFTEYKGLYAAILGSKTQV